MSILSGPEIARQIYLGNIEITPLLTHRFGPNSYDVALGPRLAKLNDNILDLTKAPEDVEWFDIPEEGFVLRPNVGYLGHTEEFISSQGFVPWIDGRSTVGRYHLQCHQTAGRGDDGFSGSLTLELLATWRPVRVYAGLPIAQVSFFRLEGARAPYKGRYSQEKGVRGIRLPKPLRREQ